MSLIILAFCTLWILVQTRGASLSTSIVLWSILGVTLVGLSAAEIGPLAELLPLSNRGALPFDAALGGLDPLFLLNTLFRSSIVIPESYTYFGGTLIPLLLYDFATRATRTRKWWYAALGFVVLSLGTNTPFYGLLLRIPLFASFRAPDRWYPYAIFAIAVISALSFEKWLEGYKPKKWLTPIFLGLGLVYGILSVASLTGLGLPFRLIPQALLLIFALMLIVRSGKRPHTKLFSIVFIALIALDIGWVDWELLAPQSEAALIAPDALITFLSSAVHNDERIFAPFGRFPEVAAIVDNLHTADGYDPFILRSYINFSSASIKCNFTAHVVGAPPTRADALAAKQCAPVQLDKSLLALLDVHYVILPADQQLPEAVSVYHDESRQVYDIGPGVGRAFGVTNWIAAPADDAGKENCIQQLGTIDTRQTAILDVSSSQNLQTSELGPATIIDHQFVLNGEHFTIQAAQPTLLVRSEVFAPGWKARIDNMPTEVMRADCTLQGIFVQPGKHDIEFTYSPDIFPVAVVVSSASLLVVMIYGLLQLFSMYRGLSDRKL